MNSWVYLSFTVALLCQSWIFFRDRKLVPIKIVSSVTLVALIVLLATSYSSWLGWSAGEPQPGVKYSLVAADIRLPAPDRAGHIYVWLSTPILPENKRTNPFLYPIDEPTSPRTFDIPFTEANEKAMQRALGAMGKGKHVSAMFGDAQGQPGDSDISGDADDEDSDPTGLAQHRGHGQRQHLNGQDTSAPTLFIEEPGDGGVLSKG